MSVIRFAEGKKLLARNILQNSIHINEGMLHDAEHRKQRYQAALQDLLTKSLSKEEIKNTDHVAIVLDAPWGGSFWKDVVREKNNPIKYTKQVLKQLEKQALDEYESIHKAESDHQQTLLGLTPIHEKLNGYHFEDPLGKRAEKIVVTFQYDLVAQRMVDDAKRVISKVMPHHKVGIYTRDALLYSALQHFTASAHESTLFVFVDDVRTSVILRTSKGAVEKRVLQIGLEAIIEKITQQFTKEHRQAEHLLDLYFQGVLEEALVVQVKDVCADVASVWERQLRQVVGQVVQSQELPERIVYTISDSFERIIPRTQLEAMVVAVLPTSLSPTFFDFRDNALVVDGPGIVSDQVVHLYTATLL